MARFGGGFGGFGGGQMGQLMKQAQKMQEQMQKAQEELENAEIEGKATGDAVVVVMNGKKVLQSITINPDYVDVDDIEMLEDLIVVAMNDAYKKADELYKEKMGPLGSAGGMF